MDYHGIDGRVYRVPEPEVRMVPCPACKGRGKIQVDRFHDLGCAPCNGAGHVNVHEAKEIVRRMYNIPEE